MTQQQDAGWAGFWQPVEIRPEFLEHLRDVVGEPVLMESGTPYEWAKVNLRDGQVVYPDRGGRRVT